MNHLNILTNEGLILFASVFCILVSAIVGWVLYKENKEKASRKNTKPKASPLKLDKFSMYDLVFDTETRNKYRLIKTPSQNLYGDNEPVYRYQKQLMEYPFLDVEVLCISKEEMEDGRFKLLS